MNAFKYSFFPYTIWEWNTLDLELRNAKSSKNLRNTLLKLGRPAPGSIYRIHHPLCLKFLNRLSLALEEDRFKHNFENCINPLYTCSLEVESINHFFLHLHYYWEFRNSFLNDLNNISPQLHYFLITYLSKHFFMAIQFSVKVTIKKYLKLQ